MVTKKLTLILMIMAIIIGPTLGIVLANNFVKPTERHITVKARQFGYDPDVIKVNLGDKVTIDVVSEDVTHGFYLDGHNVNLTVRPAGDPATATFVADKTGRFSYRCSQTCGVFHPFMSGVLIVEPNHLFPGAIGLAIGLGIAALLYLWRKEDDSYEQKS